MVVLIGVEGRGHAPTSSRCRQKNGALPAIFSRERCSFLDELRRHVCEGRIRDDETADEVLGRPLLLSNHAPPPSCPPQIVQTCSVFYWNDENPTR